MVHWQSTDGFPNGIVVTFGPGGGRDDRARRVLLPPSENAKEGS